MDLGLNFSKKYVVEGYIGKGAFATVFACKQRGSSLPLAAKLISFEGDRRLKWEGENEVEVLKQLHYHPHIVTLRTLLRSPSSIILILDRLPDVPLFHGIAGWPHFDEEGAKVVMKQILEALDYCESQRIVHRDLSSVNILWQQRPTLENPLTKPWLRIIDFNLARQIPAGQDHISSDALGHTLYASPESLQESPRFSYGADIWAAGVILFVLLVGYPPFWNDNYNFLLRNIEEANYEMPTKYWKGVSEEGKKLVRLMLNVKYEDRINAKKALRHRWFRGQSKSPTSSALTETQARLLVFVERTKEHSGGPITPTEMRLKPDAKRIAYVPDEALLERSKFLVEQSKNTCNKT